MKTKIAYLLFGIVVAGTTVFAASGDAAVTEKVDIQGDHGKLSAVFAAPAGCTNYPAAIVMHGFNGNKDAWMMREISSRLNDAGIATIRFDFNGHGKSEGRFQDMTVPNEIEDAKKVYEYLKTRPEIGKIALVGHSQGGVVASMLAGRLQDKVSAVVLLAPAAVLKDDAIKGNLFGRHYDSENPPEYVEIFGRRLGRDYVIAAKALPIYETAANFPGDVMVIHGMADKIVPASYAERYKQVLPQTKLVMLEKFDHGFTQDVPRVAAMVADFLASAIVAQ